MMKMQAAIVKSLVSWKTTLIGIILLLTAVGVWFIPEMPKDTKSSTSLMLIAAALAALGIRDEAVFGKDTESRDGV